MSDARGAELLAEMERRMPERYIVAEVSKNWPESEIEHAWWRAHDDDAAHPEHGMRRYLGQRFEDVINVNHARGYKLIDWKLNRWSDRNRGTLNETIIAIFERRDG